jgi:hypothetical protein
MFHGMFDIDKYVGQNSNIIFKDEDLFVSRCLICCNMGLIDAVVKRD